MVLKLNMQKWENPIGSSGIKKDINDKILHGEGTTLEGPISHSFLESLK